MLGDPDHLVGRHRVHPAALHARVDERPQADSREQARAAGCRLAIKVRHHALRDAVRLDPVIEGQGAQPGRETPVRTDCTPDQSLARHVIQPAGVAVPLPGGKHERQIPRATGLVEAFRERDQELLRHGDPDESPDRQRVTVDDQLGRPPRT